jgi:hypothetical protein
MMSLFRPRSVIRGAAAAAPLVVLAAGCASTARVGSSRVFQLAVTEYHLAPQSVNVPSGTLSIFVHNDGRLTHNLVISTGGRPLASTQPIPPGQTTELLTALPAGKYLMSSTILSDQALGAYGTLTVTAGARATASG